MDIHNRTVMITGGSSGIGLQMAKSFLAEGANVMVCSRDKSQLDNLKKEIPTIDTYTCDLSNLADLKDLISKVGNKVDVWINNAGIFQEYNFLKPDKPFERLQGELQINFIAAAFAMTELLPYFETKEGKAFVNITAGMVYVPLVMYPMYNASKSALHSFIISLRVQLASTKIKVIEIAPPMVATRLTEGMQGKRVSPEVIAHAAINALKSGKENILVGQVKSLVFINKFFPGMMLGLLNKDSLKNLG